MSYIRSLSDLVRVSLSFLELHLLKETGLDRNTLVFFTSDNGGRFEEGPIRSMGALRERKGSIYEGGIRIPMIARWPGRVKAGSVSDHPWASCDVFPTLGDIAGIRRLPRNIDGTSVASTLFGQKQNAERRLYWESYEGVGFHQAVRMGQWTGVRHGLQAPIELYQLTSDPSEKTDVAKANKDVVGRMEEFLQHCRTESSEYPTTARPRRA
jgi:arylsulfatase A-like enzyme